MKLEEIEFIKHVIISAGAIASSHQGDNIEIELKGDNSPVTNVDRMVSLHISQALQHLTPLVPIISEEEIDITQYEDGIKSSSFWLVDPIDGTKSYIRGENTYTVNIGLIENGVPTFGFIYRPSSKVLHYTDLNKKLVVEEDGIDITKDIVRKNKDVQIAAVSSSSLNQDTRKFIEDHSIEELVRIPSSIKLCLVADGSVDLYPRFGDTMEWDIAAGHALIQATGGDIVDLDGKTVKYGKPYFLNNHFIARSKI